jgi:hypothetical protein
MEITDAKVKATVTALLQAERRVVNPESKPFVTRMAWAVEGRDWAALARCAEKVDGFEAWAGVGAGKGLRLVAANAVSFARTALAS